MPTKDAGHVLSRQTINAAHTQPDAVSFEVTGPNPCLVVDVVLNTFFGPSGGIGPSIIAIDFGAAAMTEAYQNQDNATRATTYYLAAPTIGSDTIQVTLSAIGAFSAEIIVIPRLYINAKQSAPTGGAFATAAGDGTDASVTLAAGDADDMYNGLVVARRDHALTPVGGDQFEKFAGQHGSGQGMVKVGGAIKAAGNKTFTWELGAGGAYDDWIASMVPILWDEIEHPAGESQRTWFPVADFSPVGRSRQDASASFVVGQSAPVRIR